MGPIGIPEMMAIVVIALLLFGPKKLPELGRLLGKGLTEFRRVKSELTRTFETHMRELEREARLSELQSPKTIAPSTDYQTPRYNYPYEEARADGVPVIAPPTPESLPPFVSEPASTDLIAPYEPPVASSSVNGTVARATVDFANSVQEANGHAYRGSAQPSAEPAAKHAEADEEHKA